MSQKKQEVAGCVDKLASFQSVVIILAVSLSPPSGPAVIEITKAPENFQVVFGYSRDRLPMRLDELFSPANIGINVATLEQEIMAGVRHSTCLNLRDAHGTDLAYDVEVSKGNIMKAGYVSQSSVDPNGLHRDFLTTMTIQLCSKNANAEILGIIAEPCMFDTKNPNFDEGKRDQVVAQLEKRIDENSHKNKEQKDQKLQKAGKQTQNNHTTSAPSRTHAAPPAAPVARNINHYSTSTTTTSIAHSSRPTVPANPLPPPLTHPINPLLNPINPIHPPQQAEIVTAEAIRASMAAGYYMPSAVAVAVAALTENDTRRSADLPVVELELEVDPHEEESQEEMQEQQYDDNSGRNAACSEDTDSDNNSSEAENVYANTATDAPPERYQNIW